MRSTDTPPADSRAGRGDKRIQQTEWRPESLAIAQKVAAHAAERGTTSIAFAIAWVLKNRLVSSAIAGPRTEAHWDSYMEALTLQLDRTTKNLSTVWFRRAMHRRRAIRIRTIRLKAGALRIDPSSRASPYFR